MNRTVPTSMFAWLIAAGLGCGDNANLGLNALIDTRAEPPGEQCPGGGVAIASGLDGDRDGVLDDDEVDRITYVCNGEDGAAGQSGVDGQGSLIRVSDEPPGDNCPSGGLLVEAGVDRDGDGELDSEEITDIEYVCDSDTGGPGTVAGFTFAGRVAGVSTAEIVAASADGQLLAYTSATSAAVGIVDIRDAGRPRLLGEVIMADAVVNPGAGEPTSVAFTPNGHYIITAVKDTTDPVAGADPGSLVFIDPLTRSIAGVVAVGVGPDSIAITPDGARVVVAIEDEEDTETPEASQARPGSIQIVTIDYGAPSSSAVATIPMTPDVGNNPLDPQPEYVDISQDGSTAVVTLQENNAIAIIDLGPGGGPGAPMPEVVRYIDAGQVRRASVDVSDDGEIMAEELDFAGRREPDGVCFLADGQRFITANEGDTATGDFVAGQYSGGRGFSIFDVSGALVYDSGDELDRVVIDYGMYPDGRSDNRGIELEGCKVATFGTRELAFLLLERSSAVAIYDVTESDQPQLLQLLPSPLRPESATAVPARGLLIVAGEGDGGAAGGLWLFRAVHADADKERYPSGVYRAVSSLVPATPFAGINAAAATDVPGRVVALPDDSFDSQRLWYFDADPVTQRMRLIDELRLTAGDGITPIRGYDPHGLAVNPHGGFVIAVSGSRDNGCSGGVCPEEARNRLMFFDAGGALDLRYGVGGMVDLPLPGEPGGIDWAQLPRSVFGGVAVAAGGAGDPGGLRAYVVFQRPLDPASASNPGDEVLLNHVRIGEYDAIADSWRYFFYPLRRDRTDTSRGEIFVTDIAHIEGDTFAVIERDRERGELARIKRVFAFELSSATADDVGDALDKRPVVDLLDLPQRFDAGEIDALAASADGRLWLANDNGGGEEASFFYELAPGSVPAFRATRFATFNVALDRSSAGALTAELATPDSAQARSIAEIIQRAAPDVILLNEFDYDPSTPELAPTLFQQNYLSISQNGAPPIEYPYFYVAPVNTGVASGVDLDRNGVIGTSGSDYANDAFGFGEFPGQYGMVLYSRYPIDTAHVRTFQSFRWIDMPGALLPDDPGIPGPGDYYSSEALDVFRLSSKSHWDVPIIVNGRVIHALLSHPTPPVFDGPEDRNGLRNHDEIRLFADYVTPGAGAYIYDDAGVTGGLPEGAAFVIMGDLNADPSDGDSAFGAALQLLESPRVNSESPPVAIGGIEQARLTGGANGTHQGNPAFDTGDFDDSAPGNLRLDYVLPSRNLDIVRSTVFWPGQADPLFALVGTFPFPSSDHRLVWADIK